MRQHTFFAMAINTLSFSNKGLSQKHDVHLILHMTSITSNNSIFILIKEELFDNV